MLGSGTIIKKAMKERGFAHRRSDDQFSIHGEYARNMQYVYSREIRADHVTIIDMVYFAADFMSEQIVVGLYRENPDIENGILINHSRSISLHKFSIERLNRKLDKLIPSRRDKI